MQDVRWCLELSRAAVVLLIFAAAAWLPYALVLHPMPGWLKWAARVAVVAAAANVVLGLPGPCQVG